MVLVLLKLNWVREAFVTVNLGSLGLKMSKRMIQNHPNQTSVWQIMARHTRRHLMGHLSNVSHENPSGKALGKQQQIFATDVASNRFMIQQKRSR